MINGYTLDDKPVTDDLLKANGYKQYRGKDIDIYYNIDKCTHAGFCVQGNSSVFEVGRRPWVLPDNGEAQQLADTINKCPSGALKFIRKDV
jgi:uncharacterized Fe-S cluster protein YjdI